MTIFLAIILFSVLILIHELGHFLSAKKAGIRVDEFGLGYPPRIIGAYRDKKTKKWNFILGVKGAKKGKHKKNEIKKAAKGTIYSLNLIPFGGFVKIFGQDREGEAAEQKDSFSSKSAIKRSIVLLSGVAANIILAMVLLSLVFMLGAPVPSNEAAQGVQVENEQVVIIGVAKGSPAEKIGIRSGDVVKELKIRNEKLKTEKKIIVKNTKDIQDFVNQHKGEKIEIALNRGKEILNLEVVPRVEFPKNEGALGVTLLEAGIVKYPWYIAIWKGINYSFVLLGMLFQGFYQIIRSLLMKGALIAEVAGPVGIFRMTSQAASLGLVYFLHFGAIISLNLAVLNGLPFPALDGGRFLFIIIEKLKGSPVKARTERIVNGIGFSLLMLLMLLITFRDIMKIF